MIEQDTVKLLRECDAGVQMGVESIDEVIKSVKSDGLRSVLIQCRKGHLVLEREIREALDRFGDKGKEPDPMAEKMSWLKTNVKLLVDASDGTVAELMTDGCSMGMKSLNRYLNQYSAASEDAKNIAKKLIREERRLTESVAAYL